MAKYSSTERGLEGRCPFWARIALAAAITSCTWGITGCATHNGDSVTGEDVTLEEMTFKFDQEKRPYNVFTNYRIAPGDLLDVLYQIKTWEEHAEFVIAVDHTLGVKFPRNPELNETERVRPDGRITLPYLGEVYVVGKTVEELATDLKKQYEGVLKEPELYVTVEEFRSAIRELKQDLHTAPRGLSRLVTVRPDGFATFSMVGDVYVAGRTVPEVNADLNDRYRTVLPGLTVDLFVERQEGCLIYVLGQVGNPGAYKILRPTAIVEALALAGSPLNDAKLSDVVIMRRNQDKIMATKINVDKTLHMRRGSKFFMLQPDDVVFVPRRTFAKWADVARDLESIILFRGWGVGLNYDLNNNNTVPEATANAIIGQ